eukprot:6588128-Pyramimonas_sp.AAC.1
MARKLSRPRVSPHCRANQGLAQLWRIASKLSCDEAQAPIRCKTALPAVAATAIATKSQKLPERGVI